MADVEEKYDFGETQMQLSHEIIVLDYGDERTSPYDFDMTLEQNRKDERNNGKIFWN